MKTQKAVPAKAAATAAPTDLPSHRHSWRIVSGEPDIQPATIGWREKERWSCSPTCETTPATLISSRHLQWLQYVPTPRALPFWPTSTAYGLVYWVWMARASHLTIGSISKSSGRYTSATRGQH